METVGDFLNVFNIEASRANVTLSLFFIFLGLLYWYSVYPFSVLSRCGVKHPKPVPFFGNMLMFREGYFDSISNIVKTYGRICGYYFGRKAVVLIAEPDLVKQVMLKDFSSFPNRPAAFLSKPLKDSLPFLRNEQWKRVRSIISPNFSAAKLKEVVPLINTAIDALMNNLSVHAESGEAFNIHKSVSCFTIDTIASVAFGTHMDSHKNPDNAFVLYGQSFFSLSFFRPFVVLCELFPAVMTLLSMFVPNKKREQMNEFYISSIQKILKQREEEPPDQRRRDFLQMMLDVQKGQETVSLVNSEFDSRSQKQSSASNQGKESLRKTQKQLTEDEIVGQAFIFLLGGYETTSSALAFTCYLLAVHPECQRKVQEEVDHFFRTHDSPDYTNVQELKYLDMVICESLRLYPPAFRFVRVAEHDCVLGDLFLPKGTIVEIASIFLHYDPGHWPEPENFIPERFTPEEKANRHPFVYLPFGAGPRNCVGMRLAQLEMRMVLAHLFQRFSITACSETQVPLEVNSLGNLAPKNGVFVKITRRDK